MTSPNASSTTGAAGDLPIELRLLVHDVAQALAAAAHERGVEVTCVVPRALPAVLLGDPLALHRLVRLLLGRAILLADTGGAVVLRARVLRESATHAEIRLSAKGSGVAEAARGRTGVVDLAGELCRQLASAMGGHAGVDAELGRGGILWCSVVLEKGRSETPATVPPSRRSWLPAADVMRAFLRRARVLRRRTGRWFGPPVHPVPRRATAWPRG